MANERLRDALRRSGFSSAKLAAELDVDRKTVERWVSLGRVPYARHRESPRRVRRLDFDEDYATPFWFRSQ